MKRGKKIDGRIFVRGDDAHLNTKFDEILSGERVFGSFWPTFDVGF